MSTTKRATVYFEESLHKALRLKAAETDRSISELVNEAVRYNLAEDAEDLEAFRDRVREPTVAFEDRNTSLSIPDDLFESADEVAKELGISRSELYANAVAEYLSKHRASDVTARLNEVYGEQPSGLAPKLRRAQARSIGKSDW